MLDRQPVRVRMQLPMQFSLSGGQGLC